MPSLVAAHPALPHRDDRSRAGQALARLEGLEPGSMDLAPMAWHQGANDWSPSLDESRSITGRSHPERDRFRSKVDDLRLRVDGIQLNKDQTPLKGDKIPLHVDSVKLPVDQIQLRVDQKRLSVDQKRLEMDTF